jgi:hypothetical protein
MSSHASRRYGMSRRDVIKTAVGAAAAAGPFFHVMPARAAKTLKILQWSHFVPGYDKWFNNTYTKEWGAKNGTEVIVDNINLGLIPSRSGGGIGAEGPRPRDVPRATFGLRRTGRRPEGCLCRLREDARQADRSCGQEYLQPQDPEILRLLRQLRARSGQLPLGSLGPHRHEA